MSFFKLHNVTFILGLAEEAITTTNRHNLIKHPYYHKALAPLIFFFKPDNKWPFKKIRRPKNYVSVK